MQNPFGTFSDISFDLIYKHTGGVCARGGRGQLATSIPILHLTGEHEIPEIRELVYNIERYLHTERSFQNGA